ncbi:unnamed protein product [[Actinomadura] parvosata subsp. kistnae]|uniref:Uncharacterized protein n=1 Tax=[Actinomadura] parvosata subsp. kistnae TaxID=1909395 RepID=A0A1V0ABY1_9ACTN|nr:hypothetical protein [Nonomuraea sp. ATCC 55076]AQZ67721.1 hypothetical protein BKM31_45250 [Nonomuraea sp. ATCC 55076]SPL93985.1 unnamed protein product [Actinomadura parvosata subsp. kistnae]
MDEEQAGGTIWPAVRLVILVVAGMVLGNVLLTLVMTRDPALGLDELIAFGGGGILGLLVEFGVFRRR